MSEDVCELKHDALKALCDEKHKNLWASITDIKHTQMAIILLVGVQVAIMVYDVFLNKHIPDVTSKATAGETKGAANDELGLRD